ncbi:type VII toxin-antitoxin system HepT family RNase toxin [Mangrovibacillus cuniculi]|uniref:DUF86 domain-containing protein n=1 Tax=Mangrovibacillus cuniculi TaxID=2593652 RepID=A0A7S8CDN2_9BACI|nr:DUF86 domain-containing protein [Mangrovibacillus cuniculi]QPC47878.1 DUF86 domain-containing protein [Mangrovibacillus cuniculi]
MKSDVILNKASTIERCLRRINEEYEHNPKNLENFTKQDAILLNIQRACEASIDIAMHMVAQNKLGIPQNSRDAFEFLAKNNYITEEVSFMMKSMVGFRNIAVHDYQDINLEIVQAIIEKHLSDFKLYVKQALQVNSDINQK